MPDWVTSLQRERARRRVAFARAVATCHTTKGKKPHKTALSAFWHSCCKGKVGDVG